MVANMKYWSKNLFALSLYSLPKRGLRWSDFDFFLPDEPHVSESGIEQDVLVNFDMIAGR
jgi:hypothetical protein